MPDNSSIGVHVGCKVIVNTPNGKTVDTVHKITDQKIVLKSGLEFDRRGKIDDYMASYGYSMRLPESDWEIQNTQDRLEKIRIAGKLSSFDFHSLPLAVLKRIDDLVS